MDISWSSIVKAVLFAAILGGISFGVYSYGEGKYAQGVAITESNEAKRREAQKKALEVEQLAFESKVLKEQQLKIDAILQKRAYTEKLEANLIKLLAGVKHVNTEQIAKNTDCDFSAIVNSLWNVRAQLSSDIEREIKAE